MIIKPETGSEKKLKNKASFIEHSTNYQNVYKKCNSSRTIANQRLQQVIDKDSEFFELSSIAGFDLYPGIIDSGIITGIGKVNGRDCMLLVNNPEQKAGCYLPITIKKTIRALEIALKQKLPCLHIVDSGGAYLPKQAEIFAGDDGFGRIFYMQAQLQRAKIPQFAAILGSCTAGGAYIPVMADACTMVQQHASLFLAGPPLVAAATGEQLTKQELGGSKIHCYKSGVVHHESASEAEALKWLRNNIARVKVQTMQFDFQKPKQQEDITCYIEHDPRHLPDINGIIANLVDNSEFDEFQAGIAKTIRTGWSKIKGHNIAIIANDGVLTADAMAKANSFIELAEAINVPLLFLHNTHGMLVGAQAEASGIARYGARLIQKVATTNLKKYTIMIGCSYGAGNYAMCGRAFNADFLFQWPNNKIAVMGAIQQEYVMQSIGKNLKVDATSHTAIYNSARLHDDGIIEPNNTRNMLAYLLSLTHREKQYA